tara:strand:+ start:452 stop:565 length:114 start_codon:yes stop_codon:yes gene_type:complete
VAVDQGMKDTKKWDEDEENLVRIAKLSSFILLYYRFA